MSIYQSLPSCQSTKPLLLYLMIFHLSRQSTPYRHLDHRTLTVTFPTLVLSTNISHIWPTGTSPISWPKHVTYTLPTKKPTLHPAYQHLTYLAFFLTRLPAKASLISRQRTPDILHVKASLIPCLQRNRPYILTTSTSLISYIPPYFYVACQNLTYILHVKASLISCLPTPNFHSAHVHLIFTLLYTSRCHPYPHFSILTTNTTHSS